MPMEKQKIERRKQKSEYPVLEKALGKNSEEFKMLQEAYTREEMQLHEMRMSNGSWDARFLPGILEKARERLEKKERKEAA